MPVSVLIDEKLLAEAERATGEHDHRKLLERALRDMIVRKRPPSLSEFAGQFDFAQGYDVVAERSARVLPD